MSRPRLVADQRGFTLTELMIVTAVLGVVMAGLMSLLISGQRSYMRGSNQVEAQQALRAVISRMSQEIREAGYNPKLIAGISAFSAANSTSFTIQNDWNSSGVIETNITVTDPVKGQLRGERVTYTVTGTTLTRQETQVDASAVTLLSGVQSLTFTYLDASDNVTATVASIRSIVITATAGEQSATNKQEHASVQMQVRVRVRNQQ